MTVNDEMLMAYVDGELDTEARKHVEEELARRPDLRAYVERQQALAKTLHDSLDAVLAAPVPQALTDALKASTRVSVSENVPWRRIALWSGLPAAAALACGLVIGVMMRPASDIVSSKGYGLVAQGSLGQALNQQLASAGQGEIGLTFKDKSGRYCRTFTTPGALTGVACHTGGSWRIAAVGKTEQEAGVYRQAASGMPDFLRNAVTSMMAGSPLDAQAEKKARDAGWMTR